MEMYPHILNDKQATIRHIVEKLGKASNDFTDNLARIKTRRVADKKWLAAGVILLLFFRETKEKAAQRNGEFVFQLIKRSQQVSQGGDLSCPGGILEPGKDCFLCRFITHRFPPIFRGDSRRFARKRGKEMFRGISLFTANALRESWEEVGLSPFNVTFLGPLPCYTLTLFTKTIFPVVGMVKNEAPFRLNGGEVEKVVEIPLKTFFDRESYGIYSLDTSDEFQKRNARHWDFPCLIHRDHDGTEEILWGATFNIIMSFFKIVFDVDLSEIRSTRTIKRTLQTDYLTGK